MLFTLKNFKKKKNNPNNCKRLEYPMYEVSTKRNKERSGPQPNGWRRKVGSFTQDLIVEEKQKAVSCT